MRAAGALVGIAAWTFMVMPVHAEDAGAAPPQVAEVVVARVGRECFTSLIHASGYLVPRRAAVVMLPTPGYRIAEVRAKVGDIVKRGDIVARATAVGSPPTNSSAEKPAASADVMLAAPAAGRVLQATTFVGQLTSQAAKPLFTLAIDGEIEASVDVPSVHVLELKAGQVAHLTINGGNAIDAHVRRVPAIVDPLSQMGSTRLSIDAPKDLEPSRFVRATIEARQSCGLGVPTAALQRTSAGPQVEIVDAHDVVASRTVGLGLANATDSEVTSGLAEGDLVVASPGASREGDRVKPVLSDLQDAR